MRNSEQIIERAEQVARDLAEHKRVQKATQELHSLEKGRSTLLMEALDITQSQINTAHERLGDAGEKAYFRMTDLLNGGDLQC